MDSRSLVTISWAVMSMHSWVVCSGLKMSNFLHITKKTAKFCGKHTARLAHISDKNDVWNPHLVFST